MIIQEKSINSETPCSDNNIPFEQKFSLKRIRPGSKRQFEIDHVFSPVTCRKTQKIISSIPSYNKENSPHKETFDHAVNEEIRQIHKITFKYQTSHQLSSNASHQKSQTEIYDPKPSHKFCHICKESFEDYKKHVYHLSHIKKVREKDSKINFMSLKELISSQSFLRSQNFIQRQCKQSQKMEVQCQSLTSINNDLPADEEQKQLQRGLYGSKKRVCENDEESIKIINISINSINDSTKNDESQEEQIPQIVRKRKQKRQFSIFKTMAQQQDDD